MTKNDVKNGQVKITFRDDGWPICPDCGSNEIFADYGETATDNWEREMNEKNVFKFGCMNCSWKGFIRLMPPVIKSFPA